LFFVGSSAQLYNRKYIFHNCLAQLRVWDGRRREIFDELCQNLPASYDASILIDEVVDKDMEITGDIIATATLGCKDTRQQGQVCCALIFLIERRQLGKFLIHRELETLSGGSAQEGIVSLATAISSDDRCWTPTNTPPTFFPASVLFRLRYSSLMDFGRPNTQPNQLPTPPETDIDYRLLAGIHPTMDLMNAPGVADADMNSHPSAGAFRRVSTLAYHSSSSRDLRERTTSRQTRWLIVVIPPAWLAQEHGPLGHTLASGPTQRLAQGVLMPLLPTVSGNLLFLLHVCTNLGV